MLVQQIAPVAGHEFAPVFVALELSRSKWLIGVGTPQKWTVRRHAVAGGDLEGLLALLRRLAREEERRAGLPVKVHVCFEAGRDGHWLYRALTAAGYVAYEIDPASVAVDRRARRAKSDGVDVDKLVRTLSRLHEGRTRRLPGGRGSHPRGGGRQAPASRVRAARQGANVARRPGEGAAVRARGAGFRSDGAGSAGAPGGAGDPAEAQGGAHPRMPPPGRRHRRYRGRRSGDGGRGCPGQEGQGEECGRAGAEPCSGQRRAALQAQGHRRAFRHGRRPARSSIERSGTGAASGNPSGSRLRRFRAATWRATRASPRPATAGRARR